MTSSTLTTPPEFRKTRIVCISDTHNQTPKLPRGDVLIHAGDLTNQGSYSELQRTVEWLEKADFEAKIVIAGNHDITLDEPFFREYGSAWKWPGAQDPAACRRLLMESESITYLENTSARIQLNSPTGPNTSFTVLGSPCTPKHGNWAFQYSPQEAEDVWAKIPDEADIIITHTPPKGHCDTANEDGREGCAVLTKRLEEVRPLLSVFGHVHGGRGVEKVRWKDRCSTQTTDHDNGSLIDSVEYWKDPGADNKKLSLIDLTTRSRRPLGYSGSVIRQPVPDSFEEVVEGQPHASLLELSQSEGPRLPGCGGEQLTSTLSLTNVVLHDNEASCREGLGGASDTHRDIGLKCPDKATFDVEERKRGMASKRNGTVMINAAFLGPRIAGKAAGFNKPIVVDVELPVWRSKIGYEEE